jgi:ABC-type uncharacterized transport system permease subunit
VAFFGDHAFFLVAVVLYSASTLYSVFLYRRGFRKDDHVNYLILLAAFVFHTTALYWLGFRLNRCPILNLYGATTFISWTMVLIYLVLGMWRRLRFLGAFAAPLLAGIGIFALLLPPEAPSTLLDVKGAWLNMHVGLFVMAYGAFGLSAVASLMYLAQQHDLKFRKMRALLALIPPIQRLESVAGRFLLVGFALLTMALVLSLVALRFVAPETKPFDPKLIWSLVVWIIYFLLVLLRWQFNQGGRRFAWSTIASFGFVMLTFWGASFWSPLHHTPP